MKTSLLCDLRRMDRADRSPLLRSFERHLRAANRAESTIASYLASLRQAERFLAARDVGLPDAQRADLEAFLADLLARWKPATAATRYKVLRLYYQWLEEEGEVTANPTAKLRPPIVPEQPVPVVPEDGLRRLLGTCAVRVRRTGIRAWYTGAGLDPAGAGRIVPACAHDVPSPIDPRRTNQRYTVVSSSRPESSRRGSAWSASTTLLAG
jgi:integrase